VHFFTAIDHVQLAMPPGEEQKARSFYSGILGMREIQKPPELSKRGGVWFASADVQIHLGVEEDFRPAKKAHPALCSDRYDELIEHLRMEKVEVVPDESMPGIRRSYMADCFGNRLEIMGV
jgi:catechol 2,3-dioxygenase-like lactoylglutathione lyase family enzyme